MSITGTLIIQLIVFLILVGFTMKYVWPPITAALDERAKKIADGLSAADKAKAELANANQRVEQQLAPPPVTTPPSAWPTRNAARCRSSRRPRARPTKLALKIVADAKAEAAQATIAARESLREQVGGAGRQGRRADPAQGGQRRRACRVAGPPEGRAVRP